MSSEHQQKPIDNQSLLAVDSVSRAGRISTSQYSNYRESSGKRYFFGIAIDKYQHWPQLRNAKRDVRSIAKELKEKFGYHDEDIYLLEDEDANRENIISRLDLYESSVRSQDTLIIYFAGHGHLKEGKNDRKEGTGKDVGFWIPVEGKQGTTASYISNSTILEHVSHINSLHTFLIVDACFSGIILKRGETESQVRKSPELIQRPSRWALCSGRHDEAVDDGPDGGLSPFAQGILKKLNSNREEYLFVGDLVREIRKNKIRGQQPDGGPLRQFEEERGGEFAFQNVNFIRKPADEEAWEKIIPMPEQTLNQVIDKISNIESFCNSHPKSSHYSEAISLRIKLEERRDYLMVSNGDRGRGGKLTITLGKLVISLSIIFCFIVIISIVFNTPAAFSGDSSSGGTSIFTPISASGESIIIFEIFLVFLLILLIGYLASKFGSPSSDKSASTAAEGDEQLSAEREDNSITPLGNQSRQQDVSQNPTAILKERNGGGQRTP